MGDKPHNKFLVSRKLERVKEMGEVGSKENGSVLFETGRFAGNFDDAFSFLPHPY